MSLKAGTAVRDISPTMATDLFGYPHVKRVSTGTHDPLLASVLRLDCGGSSALLVALDILMLDPPTARSIRKRVAGAAGIPESSVFISCTHTHSGPVTSRLLAWSSDSCVPPPDPSYMRLLEDKTVEAAAAASKSLVPARLACTSADGSGVGGSRHSATGITDKEVGLVAVKNAADDQCLAVVVVYGMHPTVMHEDSTPVSSDFPHYARLQIQESVRGRPVVVYHTGPAGDQSPRYFVKGQTFEEAERLGRKLGVAAAAAVNNLKDDQFSVEPALSARLAAVELPRRTLPDVNSAQALLQSGVAEYERLKRQSAPHGPLRTAECAVFGAEGTVTLARGQESGEVDRVMTSYLPIEVQALRIGDCALVGLPGELFAEYSFTLKKNSPLKCFIVSLVNGELQGYIVTPEAARAGGYEAANSLFAPEAGTILIEEALGLVTSMERSR